jgi:hypothetical protein
MAKFTGKNIEFRSGQKAIFGDNDDSSILWNDVNSELTINTVVSGVDPTDPGHLVTKRYVGVLEDAVDDLYDIHYDMQEPTGFFNRTDSVISFDDGSLMLTISGAEYEFYTIGVKHTKNGAESIAITDVEGLHHIYYDTDGIIQHTTVFTDDIILRYAYIAGVYWDATNKKHLLLAEERHGFVMDGGTHLYLHTTIGAVYDNGLGLTSIVSNGNGNLDTHAQLGYGSGRFWDEDIDINITGAVAPAQIPVYYKEGIVPVWRADVANSFPVKSTGTRLAYNSSPGGVWGQTEASNQDFVLCHLFATNDANRPIIAIQGEAIYTNISAAQIGANDEMLSLTTGGMPVKEFIPIATVIYQTSSTYSNSVNARVRPTSEGADYVDWRFSTGGGGVGLVSDHGSLSGLDGDDHVQYSLVDGTRDFTAPVGGVDATQPEHLVTYNQLTTTSGNIIDYIDSEVDSQNEFIELIDTPTTYSGLTGYHPAIKSSEDGLEFSLYSEPDLYIETTRSGNSVTYVDAWRDNSKTFQTYKETITRAGGFVSQVVTDIFDVTDGVTITDTYTNTFVRSGGFVVSETQVRT